MGPVSNGIKELKLQIFYDIKKSSGSSWLRLTLPSLAEAHAVLSFSHCKMITVAKEMQHCLMCVAETIPAFTQPRTGHRLCRHQRHKGSETGLCMYIGCYFTVPTYIQTLSRP